MNDEYLQDLERAVVDLAGVVQELDPSYWEECSSASLADYVTDARAAAALRRALNNG